MADSNHRWGAWFKRAPWLRFCARCGLVALKNHLTNKYVKAKCKGPEDWDDGE